MGGQAGSGKKQWQSEPTHFLPQFYPLFKRIVWAGEEKRSNRQQDLKPKPAASELSWGLRVGSEPLECRKGVPSGLG